ncbi:MAG: L-threonylcarbamoyladenylate synthase [Coriobacteriales bacterium]|jgi:tRNA threonylcarbamoyl adenosine modification protein (Sua5/YciO/YrdC/YwlC family)
MTETARSALARGECCLLATDTVFGLAALPGSAGYEQIFKVKRRPAEQVLPWLVSGPADLMRYGKDIASTASKLAESLWPGALTLVVEASEEAARLGGIAPDGSVALRAPDDEKLRSLIDGLGCPLACTSANLHGYPAVQEKSALDPALRGLAGYDELPTGCPGGTPSTIVDCRAGAARILRSGPLDSEVIALLGQCGATLPA